MGMAIKISCLIVGLLVNYSVQFNFPVYPAYYCSPPENATSDDRFQRIMTELGTIVCVAIEDLKNFPIQDYDAQTQIQYYQFSKDYKLPKKIDFPYELSRTELKSYSEIVIIVHGYLNNYLFPAISGIGQAYQTMTVKNNKTDFLIIGVDWSAGSFDNYVASRSRVSDTAQAIADRLKDIPNLESYHVRCVGHSLGGQICGNVGKFVNLTSIISLDPAGVGFFKNSPDRQIQTDAKYVEVLHTNGKDFGYFEPCGDSDVYAFGGTSQPFCVGPVCSHNMAVQYHIDTVLQKGSAVLSQCSNLDAMARGNCQINPKARLSDVRIAIKSGIYRIDSMYPSKFPLGPNIKFE